MVFGGEMNDALETTSFASLAIVEKKPQRPGGCVGIFFQLFDWNRRFAKKKLFSRKLLPPVRLKPSSKKFGGDDKQPKHRLIADENSGGFPSAKKSNVDCEQKHEMRAPSLVARLMGLESMPSLQKEKSKKVQSPGFGSGKSEKLVDSVRECPKEDWNVDKGGTKLELRPQKLQKTSFSERRPFGAEVLPFKNVLSKSKKHHQKLPSPVKSPRNLSRKNASKLIGAATKILEPGLQRSRSKCALTYTNNIRHLPEGNIVSKETMNLERSELDNPDDFGNVASKREFSCRNCGHVVDNLDSKTGIGEQPMIFGSPFSGYVGEFCEGSERCNPGREAAVCREYEEEMNENYYRNAAHVSKSIQSSIKAASDRRMSNGHIRPQKDMPSSFSSNQQTRSQSQMLRAKHMIPPRSKPNSLPVDKVSMVNAVNERKNHVLPNPNYSGNNRSRMSTRIDNGKFEMEKRISGRHNDLAPGRKRRPVNVTRQAESSAFVNSTFKKQTYGFVPAKELGSDIYTRGNPRLQPRTVGRAQVDHNASFVFKSSMQQKTGVHAIERKGSRNDSGHSTNLQKPPSEENGRRAMLDDPCPISGDALGALLEQKLKELTCQGEDSGSNAPKKSTAMILQELISALTSEIPFQQKKPMALTDVKVDFCDQSSTFSPTSQGNAKAVKTSADQPFDGEHLSPGSVLESYFSNESCLSNSVDDSLGYKMPHESVDYSYNEPCTLKPGSELLDSATSMNCYKELTGDILDSVSETLCCINLSKFDPKESRLDHVQEVLLNSELVLRSAASSGSFIQRSSPVKQLLLDELETFVGVLWMSYGHSLGEQNQLQRFALDTIIEFLGLRFGRYPEPGSKVSSKLPLCLNPKSLLFEIVGEVRKWGELSRFLLDELVEWEMSHSLSEWTQFDIETYEAGMEVSRQLFHDLVDEIVVDLSN